MSSSNLIRHQGLDGQAVAWEAPVVPRPEDLEPEIDPEQVRREAYEAGFAQGEQNGFASGAEKVQAHAATLNRAIKLFTQPLANLDHRVEEELIALVQAVARALLRREIDRDASHLVGVIREGLAVLPVADQQITLRLNKADVAIVREYLSADGASDRCRVDVDPSIERGGCVLFTTESQVDGRLETRLARVIEGLFEDRRSRDDKTSDSDEC